MLIPLSERKPIVYAKRAFCFDGCSAIDTQEVVQVRTRNGVENRRGRECRFCKKTIY